MTTAEVAKQDVKPTLGQLIKNMQPEIAKVLPNQMSPERMARIAATVVRQTPQLARCEPLTVLGALMTASQLGLEPGPIGEAYLVPFNTKTGMVCQFIPGYRGLIKLARNSGQLVDIWAEVVYEADEKFSVNYGLHRDLVHVPKMDADRGKPTYVYAAAELKDGGRPFVVMTVAEVEAIRARSRAGKNGPWVTDWAAMAKKGLALDTPIPTDTGWTTMDEIEVGATVFDMDGLPTRVMAVSEVKNLPCYRVTFSNGEQITCDHEHIWVSKLGGHGPRITGTGKREPERWGSRSVGELYAAKLAGRKVTVPVASPLNTEVEKLPIDPWLLGYWLGNGHRNSGRITCNADDLDAVIEKITATRYTLGAVRPDPRSNAVDIGVIDGFLIDLRENGILGSKRVPDEYRRAAEWQRRELLAGLIDSDGHICKARGRVHFSSTDAYLSDLVAELASSLGEVVQRRTTEARGYGRVVTSHEVHWKPSQCPADLPRKAASYRERQVAAYRAVKSIELVESVPTRCIAVESETRTYLAGRTMVPTHNTVIKQLSKWLPLSAEFNTAAVLDGATRTEIGALVDVQPEYVDGDVVGDSPAIDAASDEGAEPDNAQPDALPPVPAEPPADVMLASKTQLAKLAQVRAAEKYDDDASWFGWLTDVLGVSVEAESDITETHALQVLGMFQEGE